MASRIPAIDNLSLADLTELAVAAGMKVVTSVSASLDFLCCGDKAGWSKMKKANELGVPLVRGGVAELAREVYRTGYVSESGDRPVAGVGGDHRQPALAK